MQDLDDPLDHNGINEMYWRKDIFSPGTVVSPRISAIPALAHLTSIFGAFISIFNYDSNFTRILFL